MAVIPIPAGSKNPGRSGWERLRIRADEVGKYWSGGQNLGLLTGEPSGWLVDVDLDADEAVRIAGRFLPPTLTSGRESRPHSHWWYVSPGTQSRDFKDTDGEKLVELRASGRQTLVAPSTHPDGDVYTWHPGPGPEEIPADDLYERCRELATAALIARHVPTGGRHDYALALAGFLLRPGRLEEKLALKILNAAWHAAGADTREALRDLANTVRSTAANIAGGHHVTGGPTLEEEYAPGMVRVLSGWWGWRSSSGAVVEDGERKPTQAELLIQCAQDAELFHTPAGDAYAAAPVSEHRETHPVRSRGFRRWLMRRYYEEHGRPPGSQALQDALNLLEARAHFDAPEREVYVRVAGKDGNVYIDLCNEHWEVAEIRPDGWRVVQSEDAPVRFRRPAGLLPLPRPVRGDGALDGLRRHINVRDEASWRLLIAWVVAALRPDGPYPVLILQGEQGSAKSTTARLLQALVDPCVAPLRGMPRSEHDLYVAADNGHVVAFDNISTIRPWLSDALCSLATGGGFATRTLYENREQELFDAMRPVILNGIADVATRPDLLDRGIVITLAAIPDEERKREAEVFREFERLRPAVLGALFDAVAGGLSTVESLRLEELPRMADFACFAVAAESALGWEPGSFMEAYTGNRREATKTALEADPVAGAVWRLAAEAGEWTGTATALWQELSELAGEDVRRTEVWPKAPNTLANRLKRLAPNLRQVGIEYGDYREPGSGRRLKSIKIIGVKYRHSRHSRHTGEETPANGHNPGVTVCDDTVTVCDDTVTDRHSKNPCKCAKL